jgi:hypothetical protein
LRMRRNSCFQSRGPAVRNDEAPYAEVYIRLSALLLFSDVFEFTCIRRLLHEAASVRIALGKCFSPMVCVSICDRFFTAP